MNDMLGKEIKLDDIVLYDNQICKIVSSTKGRIKYVTGAKRPNVTELYEHGTTMSDKVLKLTDFDNSIIDQKLSEVEPDTLEYVTPSKRPLSIEEQATAKQERQEKNTLKNSVKEFDIIKSGYYDNFVYIGRHKTVTDDDATAYHCYVRIGYFNEGEDMTTQIVAPTSGNNSRTFSLHTQKTKKQPTEVQTGNNESLKQFFSTISTERNYYQQAYSTIKRLVGELV